MEAPVTGSLQDLIIQAVKECVDSDLLDLIYKLLCFVD